MCKKNCKDCKCITIGADVEFFLSNGRRELSAIGRIPGTKASPYILNTKAGLHHDNVCLEISFLPFKKWEFFNQHIIDTLKEVRAMIAPLQLVVKASTHFTAEELDNEEAWKFGCDPDFNAWTRDINRTTKAENQYLRSCGGHVHIGIKKLAENMFDGPMFIKNLDATLGIYSLKYDKDRERRLLYGKAGAFRPKEYGVEYRVLSNFWVDNEEYRKKVWSFIIAAGTKYIKGDMEDITDLSIPEKINRGEE